MLGGLSGPIAVGGGARGAGVQDGADADLVELGIFESVFGTLLGKGANANDPRRLQSFDDRHEVRVTGGFDRALFGG